MASMSALVVATAAFLLTHFVTSTPLRAKLVGAIGEWPYRGLYSLVALVTLVWMIWAYAAAPREVLWNGMRELPRLVMPLAFILIACGYWRNPTMVGADNLLKSEDPARGIIRITRHPIMWGIMLWAAAHILARGELRAAVFFGGLLLLAALGTILIDRRKACQSGFPAVCSGDVEYSLRRRRAAAQPHHVARNRLEAARDRHGGFRAGVFPAPVDLGRSAGAAVVRLVSYCTRANFCARRPVPTSAV